VKKFSMLSRLTLIVAIFFSPLCFFGPLALAKISTNVDEKVVQSRKVQFIRNIYAIDKEGQPVRKGTPSGIAVDQQGKLFIIFPYLGEVQVFDADGKFLYRFGKKGSEEGEFWLPSSIEIAGDGMVFILDAHLKKVMAFSNKGEFQYEFRFTKRRRPGDNSAMRCSSIGLDRGNKLLYLSDSANSNIKMYDFKGKFLGIFPLAEKLSIPGKLYFDSRGNIYILDIINGKVHIYNTKKEFLFSFGRYGERVGNLVRPIAICLNPKGNIYVLDRMLSVIQVFYPDGKVCGVIKDTEIQDGLGAASPSDMVINDQGRIFVACQAFHCIKILQD